MFLLGRGLGAARLLRLGVRHKNSKQRAGPKPAVVVERDAQGRPIVAPREKSLGTFKPLSVANLKHELFETDGPGRVELDLPMLHPRTLAPGAITRFHNGPTSPLRVYGVPKHMLLEFRILGAPCAVTTSSTLSIVRVLEESKDFPARLVLNGRPGCGKSFLLLQAVQYAHASADWIVIYIPRTKRFVDSSTPHSYSLATRTYLQPRAARETLSRIGRANTHHLEQLQTTATVILGEGRSLPVGTPLQTLIETGAAEESLAPAALDALMHELGSQTAFPVLLAMDDFQALAGGSNYRDPQFKMIRPHHLGMPRLLLEYASGRRKLARGLVLGALSRSDPQFPVSDQLADSLSLPVQYSPSPRSVRFRRSSQLAEYLDNEVVLEAYDPTLFDTEPDDDLPAPDAATAAEVMSDEVGPEAEAEAEDADIVWTGWNVYDPPVYEDTLRPTADDPFPTPKPAEIWKELVIPKEEQESTTVKPEEDVELDEEVESQKEVEAAAKQKKGKMGKEKMPNTDEEVRIRALRAVRVPDALSVREAAALFELWLDAGVLRTGGQRRAIRRVELQAFDEYRTMSAQVDSEIDPEMNAAEYDPEAASAAPDIAAFMRSMTKTHPPSSPEEHLRAAEQDVLIQQIAEEQKTLEDPEMEEVAVMEGALTAEKLLQKGREWDAGVRSLDAEMAAERLERAKIESGAYDEAEEGEEGEENEENESEDEMVETPAEKESPTDDALEAFAQEFSEEQSASEDSLDDDDDIDPNKLDLGDDAQLAQFLSDGLRGAFSGNNPERLSQLMRAPVDSIRVEPESGADDLFLAKYAESSGNARAFVWGGLLGTLQTSMAPVR
ncbi:mitochondrial ribosomal death-associated protein 3-domain-containing protein [Mycena amicta]|nr:mitochondrial ribosomal death-associated protein 3-domain-containing protein [Mycena amicta]